MVDYLDELEGKSIFALREARRSYKKIGVLCSMGKDSLTVLWLIRKAFFGEVPFKVIHIDTGFKFPEIYEFRDRLVKEWGLDLVVARNDEALKKGISPDKVAKFLCCSELKTNALKQLLKKEKFDALILGIRRDEHGIRSKERYFSPRDKDFKWNVSKESNAGDSGFEALQDSEMSGWSIFGTEFKDADHVRIHPILHWGEKEIWEYVLREKIPVVGLYFSKGGKRYRSIGCAPCCKPVDSNASTVEEIVKELGETSVRERSGRSQDKENEFTMQKLRSLGYM